jgi:hypothetical protein
MAAQSEISQISVSVKMLAGDLFTLEIPSDITIKQFYKMVWKMIPTQIPLQSLELIRQDSEEPLPQIPMALIPQLDEVFFAFIQTSHFTLRLELVSDAFHQQTHYHVFEIAIHESHPDTEESKSNPPSIPPFDLPLTQNGRIVDPCRRYNVHRVTFLGRTHLDSKGKISEDSTHTFYSYDDIDILQRGRFGDEWEIDIPQDTQPLPQLTDLLQDLPVSERTLCKLSESLLNEWDIFFHMSMDRVDMDEEQDQDEDQEQDQEQDQDQDQDQDQEDDVDGWA